MTLGKLAYALNKPNFVNKLHAFTANADHDSNSNTSLMHDSDLDAPKIDELITVYPSALATYSTPSDMSSISSMCSEHICTTPNWRKEGPHYDTVFVNTNSSEDGMCGLDVAHVKQFFSFNCQGHVYLSAAIQWYSCCGDEPDKDTGMWIVEPDICEDGKCVTYIIHLDTIFHSAHLIAMYGNNPIPKDIPLCHTLDLFHLYYVNKFIDHHAFKIVF